jgi:hypothetical protein
VPKHKLGQKSPSQPPSISRQLTCSPARLIVRFMTTLAPKFPPAGFFYYYFSVLGLELRAFTVIYSASPFCDGYHPDSVLRGNYLSGRLLILDPPDICFLSS